MLVPEPVRQATPHLPEANGKRYVLERPKQLGDGSLVAGKVTTRGATTTAQLVPAASAPRSVAMTADANARAPATPAAPQARRKGRAGTFEVAAGQVLWQDGRALTASNGQAHISDDGLQHCLSLTWRDNALNRRTARLCLRRSAAGAEGRGSLAVHLGQGRQVRLRLQYRNPNGPINTGVTAAVKQLVLQCPGQPLQRHTVTLPHSVAVQDSTSAVSAPKGRCTVALEEGST